MYFQLNQIFLVLPPCLCFAFVPIIENHCFSTLPSRITALLGSRRSLDGARFIFSVEFG